MIVPSYQGILVPGVAAGGDPIDVGHGAHNGPYTNAATYTYIGADNPANDTGILDTMEFWFNSAATGVKCGTFYGSGSSYTSRDYETIGNVTAGSKQTFSALDCNVETGDYLGVYHATGLLDRDDGVGNWYKSGDQFGAGAQTYAYLASSVQNIYATGET